MARYSNTKLKNNKLGRAKNYNTTIYNKISESNDDMYFLAQEGDRCDNLAFQFYGDASFWWFIARVNNLKTLNIPAGTSLRIPISTATAKGL